MRLLPVKSSPPASKTNINPGVKVNPCMSFPRPILFGSANKLKDARVDATAPKAIKIPAINDKTKVF